ncbi:MAG: hypothetical protein WCL30_06290, partial [Pseudomonadota bacterium]
MIKKKDKNKLASLKTLANKIYESALTEAESLNQGEITESKIRAMAEIGRRIMFIWCLGNLLSEVINEVLIASAEKLKIKAEEVSALIPPLKTPLFEAQANLHGLKRKIVEGGYWEKLHQDPAKALIEIEQDQDLHIAIEDYSKKFGWTTVLNMVGEDPSVEQVIDQVLHLVDENKTKSKELPADKDLIFLIEAASTIAYLRQSGVEYFSIYSRPAMKMFKRLAEQLDLAYEELLNLNLEEMIAGVKGTELKSLASKRNNDN